MPLSSYVRFRAVGLAPLAVAAAVFATPVQAQELTSLAGLVPDETSCGNPEGFPTDALTDGDVATFWQTGNAVAPCHFVYRFDAPVAVSALTLHNAPEGAGVQPSARVTIWASHQDRGRGYFRLVSQALNPTGPTRLELDEPVLMRTLKVAIENVNPYASYRVNVGLAEIEMETVAPETASRWPMPPLEPLPVGDPITQGEATLCDELAGYPYNPDSYGHGFFGSEIDVDAALAACRTAVAENPESMRLVFQLARVEDVAEQSVQSVARLGSTLLEEYAPAQHLLALALRDGDGVAEDWDRHLALLETSADAGYLPSRMRLARIAEDAFVDALQDGEQEALSADAPVEENLAILMDAGYVPAYGLFDNHIIRTNPSDMPAFMPQLEEVAEYNSSSSFYVYLYSGSYGVTQDRPRAHRWIAEDAAADPNGTTLGNLSLSHRFVMNDNEAGISPARRGAYSGEGWPIEQLADRLGGEDAQRLHGFSFRRALAEAEGAIFAYWYLTKDPRTLRELIIQSRDAYHEPWVDVAEAATALGTAEAAVSFVSDRIGTSVYEGRLQTPEAVLETRTANPADKAMLLQALLAELDVSTEAMAAPLQGDLRAAVLTSAAANPIAMPEPMQALMRRVGYDDEDLGADQLGDALEAAVLLDNAEETIETALSHARDVLDLEGPSTAQAVFLDWVWLVGEDGTIYDPLLPNEERSDLARAYSDELTPTQITLTGRDRFGRTREIVSWSGNAYGTDVELAFYPTINTLERLIGSPDLSDVGVWTPGIVVGDELVTEGAVTNDGDVVPQDIVASLSIAEGDGVDVSGFTAPEISSLSIAGVDPSTFPRVTVGLNAAVQNIPNWHSAHFTLEVEGERVPVRIEEPYATSTDVIVVHDQSGSMREDDRFDMARLFNRTVTEGLSPQQRLAVIALNDRVRVQRLFDPLDSFPADNPEELWDLTVRGTTGFLDAMNFALNAIEVELGGSPETRTSIVLVTDGTSTQADMAALQEQMDGQLERALGLNAAIYPVILSSAQGLDFETLASETGGQLIRVQDPARITSAAQALARRLSGSMAISFTAPSDPVPDAGTEFAFTLQVEGYNGTEAASYVVPDDIFATDPAVFVEISAGAHHAVRPVVALGDAYDVDAMTGRHSVYLAPGAYPGDRMVAQWLSRWLFAHDAAVEDTEALVAQIQAPGLSITHATTMNGLANMMRASLGEGQALQFPIASVRHSIVHASDGDGPGREGDEVEVATVLDVPAWSTFLSEPASREDVARMGLTLNDAEARLLGDGLNLTASFSAETPALIAMAEGSDDGLQELRGGAEDYHWWHDPETGSLFGYLDHAVLAAKGSRDVEIAQHFKDIESAIDMYLGVAAPGIDAMPSKAIFSGFVAMKKEELKLWCYATIMMNYVGEAIAGEEDAILNRSVPEAEARAAQLCGIDGDPADVGQRMAQAAATAVAEEVWNGIKDQLPEGVSDAFSPPDLPGWIGDQLGQENLTNWISDPTVRGYAEGFVGQGRDYLGGKAQELAGQGYTAITGALQRHGLGGGTGMSGGMPTTRGFDAALQRAIEGL
eukprot:g17399.t1